MKQSNVKMAVIIAAGGKGCRFGAGLPKQFLEIDGIPMIVRSMSAFREHASCYVVSITPGYAEYLKGILPSDLAAVTRIVEGGSSRYDSVKNALAAVPDDTQLVAVHDAARPFVDKATIDRVAAKAMENGAALPAVPVVDSIRKIRDDGTSSAEDRSRYVAVQTPQIFRLEVLRRAYGMPYDPRYTDDASLVEAAGDTVVLAEGNPENIKVTFPNQI